MTHPFHPWSGRDFELKRRRSWELDRVYFYGAGGVLVCLPAEWTDVVAPDPFVVVAVGRAPFRTGDLLAAADLAARLRPGGAPGVGQIMP